MQVAEYNMQIFNKVFKTRNPVIGALHLTPLVGYKGYKDTETVLKTAIQDLEALDQGGVDGILIENNYDIPHKINVGPEIVACMTYITSHIINRTNRPVGVSVLWNDFKATLAIAKICGGKFVRIPVFVDNVRTSYGDILGNPEEVVNYRKKIQADHILLLTDIHVKHSTLLNKDTLEESAQKAVNKRSNGLVITGEWTADAPQIADLIKVRKAVGNFPILIGSGVSEKNINKLIYYADGVILGTSLKTGRKNSKNINIKSFTKRIDKEKVKSFVKKFRKFISNKNSHD